MTRLKLRKKFKYWRQKEFNLAKTKPKPGRKPSQGFKYRYKDLSPGMGKILGTRYLDDFMKRDLEDRRELLRVKVDGDYFIFSAPDLATDGYKVIATLTLQQMLTIGTAAEKYAELSGEENT